MRLRIQDRPLSYVPRNDTLGFPRQVSILKIFAQRPLEQSHI